MFGSLPLFNIQQKYSKEVESLIWMDPKSKDMKRSKENADCSVQVGPKKLKTFETQMEDNIARMEALLQEAECVVCLDIPRGNVNR